MELGSDTTLCLGESLVLDAENPGANNLWSNGATGNTLSLTSTTAADTTIGVTASDPACAFSDSIRVVFAQPSIALPDTNIVCNGDSQLLAPLTAIPQYPGTGLSWSTGETNNSIVVSQASLSILNYVSTILETRATRSTSSQTCNRATD